MRLFDVLIPFALFSSTLFGIDNHTSCNINVTPNQFDYSHLKLEHQVTYQTLQDQVFLFDLIYKPYLDKSHHIETGVGARQFFGKYGVGCNLFYAANNNSGYFGHQLNYGFEFFYSRLQFSINQYKPIFPEFKSRKEIIRFPLISELGITYKPSSKYEFGLYTYYDHFIDKFGAKLCASVFISNAIELEISPYYRPLNNGVCFSIGYHLGGSKSRNIQSIRKSREFYYVSQHIKPKPVKLDLIPDLNTITEKLPIVAKSVIEEPIVEIPKDIPVIEPIVKTEDIPPHRPIGPSRNWRDFFLQDKLITDVCAHFPGISWKKACIIAAATITVYYYKHKSDPSSHSSPRPESPYNDPELAKWVSIDNVDK